MVFAGCADCPAMKYHDLLGDTASYSYPHTGITISAEKSEHEVIIQFQNSGEDIPSEFIMVSSR